MSLLNPALLFGFALVAVPVLLHLLLRAKPKKLMFPALRLLKQRRIQNVRRMRLRQWWLLLLRMGVIGVFVLALCRPSLPPAQYAPTFGEWIRLSVVAAFGAVAYSAVMTWWQRQRLPRHDLQTRRTMLRGGVGVGTVLLALLFVAWPYQRRVAAEITSPAPNALDDLPVAAVFVCDNSLSLSYQFQGKSLLAAAQPMVSTQLGQLPSGSKAAVMEAGGKIPPVFTHDLTAVQNRVQSLTVEPVVQSLNERLRAAIRFQQDDRRRTLGEQASVAEARRQDKYVREIYIVTDLAKSAWQSDDSGTLKSELSETPWLGVYLLDVGVEQPTNHSVIKVRPARDAAVAQGSTMVEAVVRSQGGQRDEATVELWLSSDGAPAVKRDQQTVSFISSPEAAVRFSVDGVTGRVVQGDLRLALSDPLSADDTGYFTIRVLPPLDVLVVAEEQSQANSWLVALQGLNSRGETYKYRFATMGSLLTADVTKYDVVCLINAASPPREVWDKLAEFAKQGGGVAVFLGAPSTSEANAGRYALNPVSYNSAAAKELLPATLKARLQFQPAQQLNFREGNQSLVQRLETLGALAELADIGFSRYWSVEPHPSAATLARWTDDAAQPALLLREVGAGRVALFASSVMGTSLDGKEWNGWHRDWTYLVFADQLLQLLSRQAVARANFQVDEPVSVLLPESATGNLLLRLPDLTQRKLEIPAGQREVTINDVSLPGHYQVAATKGQTTAIETGFSLNLPAEETNLERMTSDDLDDLLGAKRYGLARDPQSLSRSVQTGRLGQEVYGLLLACLVAVFVGEQLTATWFYRTDEA
ncbi:MAG: BatA domain-containing protein [Planctomycetaceae bacterium]|nr:BatA domain-containing protein [Planctomycetaceae bacterium]